LRSTAAGFASGAVEIRSGGDGSLILLLEGSIAGARFGSALAAADVDGDGADDLLVGAPLFTAVAGVTGRVAAFALPSGAPLLTVDGAAGGDRFGAAICSVSDIDLDGRDDFAVGAPFHDGPGGNNSGVVRVCSGIDGSTIALGFGGSSGDRLGESLSTVGDLDGDGLPEIAAGAPFAGGLAGIEAGRVVVIGAISGLPFTTLEGSQAGEHFGASLAAPGDLDGDAWPDLVIGAPDAAGLAGTGCGRVSAFELQEPGPLWSVEGSQAGEQFGGALAQAGDPDGDVVGDVVVGARAHDGAAGLDSGLVAVLSGGAGSVLFAVEGSSAFEQLGFAVGGGVDLDDDGRPEALAGAPLFDATGAPQAGRLVALRLDPPVGRVVNAYAVGSLPERVIAVDADSDGDLDLAVLCAGDGTLHLLWNGDHDPLAAGSGIFDLIPPTIVTIDGTAVPRCIAGGDFDGDGLAEFAIGRADGKVQLVDGSGSPMAPTFGALNPPITIDARPLPGPVSDIEILSSTSPPSLVASLAGALTLPGEIRVLNDPFGAPAVGAPLVSGGSFTDVAVVDLDGNASPDIVAVNASAGIDGGVHLLLGPGYGTAGTGSPYALGGTAYRAAPAALDLDGIRDDLVVASVSFSGGGAAALYDYSAGGGFAGSAAVPGLGIARAVASGPILEGQSAVVIADGTGNVFLLADWDGSGFTTIDPLPVGSGVVDLAVAQLTAAASPLACNLEEVIACLRGEGKVRVVRQALPGTITPIPGTGCPANAPLSLIGFTGSPVIGDTSFGISLSGASARRGAILVAHFDPVPGTSPAVFPWNGCGLAVHGTQRMTFITPTDMSGNAYVPAPINPGAWYAACIEITLQWAVQDGGPFFGFTLSDAAILRVGEL
jgi:hypothetical protein